MKPQTEPNHRLDKRTVLLVFILVSSVNIIINIDHGVIPAATEQIKVYFDIKDTGLGLMGSMIYFGVAVFSLISGKLYLKFKAKTLILISLIANVLCLLAFNLTSIIGLIYAIRFFTGFFQASVLIYFPVWVDVTELFLTPSFSETPKKLFGCLFYKVEYQSEFSQAMHSLLYYNPLP